MPEKLNIAFWHPTIDPDSARVDWLLKITGNFSDTLGNPDKVMLIDCSKNDSNVEYPWKQANSLISSVLTPNSLLMVYFANNLGPESYRTCVHFENTIDSISFVVSLPSTVALNLILFLEKLCKLHGNSTRTEYIALAGKEVEIPSDLNSIKNVIEYACGVDSLIDWIAVNVANRHLISDLFKEVVFLDHDVVFSRGGVNLNLGCNN